MVRHQRTLPVGHPKESKKWNGDVKDWVQESGHEREYNVRGLYEKQAKIG